MAMGIPVFCPLFRLLLYMPLLFLSLSLSASGPFFREMGLRLRLKGNISGRRGQFTGH